MTYGKSEYIPWLRRKITKYKESQEKKKDHWEESEEIFENYLESDVRLSEKPSIINTEEYMKNDSLASDNFKDMNEKIVNAFQPNNFDRKKSKAKSLIAIKIASI